MTSKLVWPDSKEAIRKMYDRWEFGGGEHHGSEANPVLNDEPDRKPSKVRSMVTPRIAGTNLGEGGNWVLPRRLPND